MKMKSLLTPSVSALAFVVLLLGAAPSQAQDRMVALYAGYSFFNADGGTLSGLRLSPEYKLNGFTSVVGDFSVEKGTISSASTTVTTYLGGLRLKHGVGSMNLYAHALAGGVRSSSSVKPFQGVSISVSDNGLGLDAGGGLEFRFRGGIRMRVGGDYLRRKVSVGGGKKADENDVRATVGFLF